MQTHLGHVQFDLSSRQQCIQELLLTRPVPWKHQGSSAMCRNGAVRELPTQLQLTARSSESTPCALLACSLPRTRALLGWLQCRCADAVPLALHNDTAAHQAAPSFGSASRHSTHEMLTLSSAAGS